MANRVRFVSLTLAGFGRYDQPTRFELGGRSCSFTSPNEQGKSTFLAGLLGTLFGPPSVRSKAQEFQARNRSWNNPSAFWGELDFAVGDDRWRVRQDFDGLEVKVWRVPRDGPTELRYESKAKVSRNPTHPHAYADLLHDWLGLSDRALYEAMFTISQQSTLTTAWQVDPRIASMVYGQAVARLGGNLQELHDRFREITRQTREYHIAIGSQGERNGRSDGRLEQVVTRIAELESNIAAARDRTTKIGQLRSQISELNARSDQLRRDIAASSQSLGNWRAWVELESRLRPAVASYDRLHQLNERCQQATRPQAELRARLADAFAVFDNAPPDLAGRVESYPSLIQAAEHAHRRHADEAAQRDELQRQLDECNAVLAGEFAHHRGRPNLADKVEELRLWNDEIASERARIEELTRQCAELAQATRKPPAQERNRALPGTQYSVPRAQYSSVDSDYDPSDPHGVGLAPHQPQTNSQSPSSTVQPSHTSTEDQLPASEVASFDDTELTVVRQELEQLASWETIGADWQNLLEEARRRIEQFQRDQAQYLAEQEQLRQELDRRTHMGERMDQIEVDRRELTDRRQREAEALHAAVQECRGAVERAGTMKNRLEEARRDLDRRFVDFRGAPPQLLELWDQLHAAESKQAEARRSIDQAGDIQRQMHSRTLWRRALTGIGSIVLGCYLLWSRNWFHRSAGVLVFGLMGAARRMFRDEPARAAAAKHQRERCEAESARLGRSHDELTAQLGVRFVVPAEREAEWRRLWPTYRRELERIEAEARSVPTDEDLAKLKRAAADAETRLARFGSETQADSVKLDQELSRVRAELQQHERDIERLRKRRAVHDVNYFGAQRGGGAGTDDCVSAQTRVGREAKDALPEWWRPVRELATVVRPSISCVGELLAWCATLDDARWSEFAECCRRREELAARMQTLSSAPSGPQQPDAAPDATDGDVLSAPEDAPLVPNHGSAAALDQALAFKQAELAQAAQRLQELEAEAARLRESLAPFTAETDPGWLRERWEACQWLEWQAAECSQTLERVAAAESCDAGTDPIVTRQAEAAVVLEPFLARFDNDPQKVVDALRDRAELTARLRELDAQAAQVLAESGFATLEELAHEAGKAEGLVTTVRAGAQDLLEQANELWEAVDAPPELAAQRVKEREAQFGDWQATLDAVERERSELAATIRQTEADRANDVDALDRELASLRTEQAELARERDSIAAQFQEANRLMQELQRVERTALEGRITAYFADFSRTAGRSVALDEELHITVRNADGTRYSPEQLSHGARDQLYLAVYLAATVGFDLPFVLDDPFVNCDAERLAAIRACWDRIVPDRQLLLLSHDTQLAAWAPALEIRQAA